MRGRRCLKNTMCAFIIIPSMGLALASTSLWASSGDFDITFNGTGKKKIDLGGDEYANSVIQQPDGKLVLAGHTSNGVGGTEDMIIVRLNNDGSLDTTFNGTGKKKIDLGGDEYANSVIQQPDGKLVLAGYTSSGAAGTNDMMVVRLNTNGSLDTSFSGTGKKKIDFGVGEYANDVIQQADGKLVLVGGSYNNTTGAADMLVVRLDANGSRDTTFNGNGKKKINGWGGFERAEAVIQQADGKLVLVGSTENAPSSEMAVVRLNPGGGLDSTFNGTGKKKISWYAASWAHSIIQQTDGKLVAAGETYSDSDKSGDMIVARLNSNGNLDTSFNGTGQADFDVGGILIEEGGSSVIQQSDSKLVMVGFAGYDITMVRINANGGLDATFNGTGIKKIDLGNYEAADSVIQQSDGKLVVAGNSGSSALVFRLLP